MLSFNVLSWKFQICIRTHSMRQLRIYCHTIYKTIVLSRFGEFGSCRISSQCVYIYIYVFPIGPKRDCTVESVFAIVCSHLARCSSYPMVKKQYEAHQGITQRPTQGLQGIYIYIYIYRESIWKNPDPLQTKACETLICCMIRQYHRI